MSENIKLGSKVEIVGKGLQGVVSYYGTTSFASGRWVGVTLNKPLGKNDGEIQGKRYFTCDPNCGVFVRPTQVEVVESPSLVRKSVTAEDVKSLSTAGSLLPAPGRGERSSSPSRSSRLHAPSSLQKPKSRLSFPKSRVQAAPDQHATSDERSEPVSAPVSKSALAQATTKPSLAQPTPKLTQSTSKSDLAKTPPKSLAPSLPKSTPTQAWPIRTSVQEPERVPSEETPPKHTEEVFQKLKMTESTPMSSRPSEIASTISGTSLASGVSLVEFDFLKGQVKEWKEKYETIRIKRQEDRSKMKDLEKLKIQLQQLQDGKSRSSEQIQELSKQLREAKKAKDEAVEAKERYVDEMSDVHETIEMATLDKEMAEEKADMLQKEVESLKEKVDELQTDLEIMKAEMEEQGTEGGASNYQVKQLAEQNSKLKEALVRLRDLSAAEKSEYHNLEKQLEKKSKELNEVTQKKEKLEVELEIVEATVDELKEQVDASQGAEEMVEMLTDKNLTQEEKLMDLEEQIHDLESMNEMNEELQENARETELELREEVDLVRAKALEAQRQTEAANAVVADYQDTIQKFRKVVQDLQDSNQELRAAQTEQEEKSDTEVATPQPPAFNYQIKMVETKFRHLSYMLHQLPSSTSKQLTSGPGHKTPSWQSYLHSEAAARSIDHELRKLDLAQANMLANYLRMYMPKSVSKGGDNDAMELLLLVKRLSSKAKIIAKHVSDKFDIGSDVEKGEELLGVRGNQLTFATSLINKLKSLHVLMDSYDEALSKCSVNLLLKVGTLYREMLSYEQVLNILTEMLRKDTLDETSNTDSMDKLVQFFRHLYNVHLSREELTSASLMEKFVDQVESFNLAVSVNVKRLKSFMQPGHETSDVTILLTDMASSCDDLKRICKKIKRKMPPDDGVKTLQLPQEVKENLEKNITNLNSLHQCAFAWVTQCVKISRPTEAATLMATKMQELLKNSAARIFEGQNGFAAVRTAFGGVISTMMSTLTSMQEGEYDSIASGPTIQAPIEKRATILKADMVDSEGLTSKLEEKDVLISELRRVAKTKNDDLAEAKIRTGMLERKLKKAESDGKDTASLLQQKLDTATEDLKKKEKTYDETLDSLQSDIDALESEKAELKKRLVAQSKQRNVLTDLAFKSPGIGAAVPGAKSEIASMLTSSPAGPAKVTDSPLLREQIQVLQTALRVKSNKCSQLTGEKMIEDLKALSPLRGLKPRNDTKEMAEVRNKLNQLSGALNELVMPKVIDLSKRRPGRYPVGSNTPYQRLINQEYKLRALNEEVLEAGTKVQQAIAKSKNLLVRSDFASFPAPQLTKSLSGCEPHLIGKLDLNTEPKQTSAGKIESTSGQKLYLELDQFNKLHELMLQRSINML